MYIYKFVQVKWQRQQQLVESGKATKKVNERLGFEGLIKVLDRLIKIYIYLYSKYYKSQQHIKISWTNSEIREAVFIKKFPDRWVLCKNNCRLSGLYRCQAERDKANS